jgi:4a-hydroxytetrahydrobiopterin dehydratase
MPKLSSLALRTALKTVPRWKQKRTMIIRQFEFKDFVAAMKFVNAVARAAERACHHPDIDIRWNRVTLALTTHDQGGLTEKDFALAARCDRMAGRRAK